MDLFCRFRKRRWTPIAAWRRRRARFSASSARWNTANVSATTSTVKMGMPFPRGIKAKPGETVVFAYIVYKSRAHRDSVNAKVMKDPRFANMCDPKDMPFDVKRMIYGGFKTIVEA